MEATQATLNLSKDEKVDLTKGNPGLTKVTAGLGWNPNRGNSGAFDLDAFGFLLKGGKLYGARAHSVCFFGNKNGVPGLTLDKDNLTGVGEGDDEKIFIDLAAIPAEVEEIMIGVNIYQAASRGQNFGQVSGSYIRIFDQVTNQEYLKYDLNEDYGRSTAVIFGKLYRHNGEWKFQALGTATNGDINEVTAPYAA